MAAMIEVINQASVVCGDTAPGTATAIGSRVVAFDDGEMLCSFMYQQQAGMNDFKPALARSFDRGCTWQTEGLVWPHLCEQYSIFASISRGPDEVLYLFGTRTSIDVPGESFWCEQRKAIKQNELFWSCSHDRGRTWLDPQLIAMPIPGAAEAPGALCVTRSGQWLACYSPYNTFDVGIKVDRNQLMMLTSRDKGRTWSCQPAMRFDDSEVGMAEAWVVELAHGVLVAAGWQFNYTSGANALNPFTVSLDGGVTWDGPYPTGIKGQSIGLAALPDGRMAMVYNQRENSDPGVYLAIAQPTRGDFELLVNEPVWLAQTSTDSKDSVQMHAWTDFAFGEPAVTIQSDGTLLVVFWRNDGQTSQIYSVRICLDDVIAV